MSSRGCLRTVHQRALARCCAALIIALVLCPFTAPFASYDPNASPIGGVLNQDGSVLDKACDKAISLDAAPIALSAVSNVAPVISLVTVGTTMDLLLVRSMVLRV